MAVGIIEEFAWGSDMAFYDDLAKEIDFPRVWPEGLIYHAAGPAEGGMRIVEHWESQTDYDRYIEHTIGPAIMNLLGDKADQATYDVTVFSIHNVQVPAQV